MPLSVTSLCGFCLSLTMMSFVGRLGEFELSVVILSNSVFNCTGAAGRAGLGWLPGSLCSVLCACALVRAVCGNAWVGGTAYSCMLQACVACGASVRQCSCLPARSPGRPRHPHRLCCGHGDFLRVSSATPLSLPAIGSPYRDQMQLERFACALEGHCSVRSCRTCRTSQPYREQESGPEGFPGAPRP